MPNSFAPIGLSTYVRLPHLQQTIAALQNNWLAKESELFVFSDGPQLGDESKVEILRSYLHTIVGFKAVHIIERADNNRVANNRGGMRMLLDDFGKMIFIEEDIVTAPSFLTFMNKALDQYKSDPRVFAVNAYTPPISIPDDYRSSVILLPRFAAWGFGIWKEKFDEIIMDITPGMFHELHSDSAKLKQYCIGGDDIITQLWLQANGFINALDVRIDYTMFTKGRQYVVCPTKSLAHSTGCDGSGEHWVEATNKNDVEVDMGSNFVDANWNVQPDARIIERLGDFYALTMKGKLVKFLMEIGLYSKLKRLKHHWMMRK